MQVFFPYFKRKTFELAPFHQNAGHHTYFQMVFFFSPFRLLSKSRPRHHIHTNLFSICMHGRNCRKRYAWQQTTIYMRNQNPKKSPSLATIFIQYAINTNLFYTTYHIRTVCACASLCIHLARNCMWTLAHSMARFLAITQPIYSLQDLAMLICDRFLCRIMVVI